MMISLPCKTKTKTKSQVGSEKEKNTNKQSPKEGVGSGKKTNKVTSSPTLVHSHCVFVESHQYLCIC